MGEEVTAVSENCSREQVLSRLIVRRRAFPAGSARLSSVSMQKSEEWVGDRG